MALAGYRRVLGHRDLRLLFGAQLLSATGTWAYGVAISVWVYDRTHSLAWVAAANVVRFVPGLVLSAYAGVIAERRERIALMARADLGCAIWQGLIVVVVIAGGPVVVVLGLAVLTAATSVVYEPSVAATIPVLVDEDGLVAASALRETISSMVVLVGPAVGALLLLIGPPQWAFAFNAASFAGSALLVSRIRRRSVPVDVSESGTVGRLQQIAVGLRAIVGSRPARTLVGFSVLVSCLYGTDTVLFVAVSAHRLGTGARGYGYLLAGLGLGGIVMGLAIDRLSQSARLAPLIIGGTAGYCLPTVLLAVTHSPELAFAVQVLRGGSTLIVDVLAVIALQRAVPPDRLARAFGVFGTLFIAAVAAGALITPPLIAAAGLDGALLTLAVAPLTLGLLGLPALIAIDGQTQAAAEQIGRRVAMLDELEIFSTGSRQVLERLASVATEVAFAPGALIVTEGEAADALYVLAVGAVQISSRGERDGPVQAITTVQAPAYFGEIGVLAGIPRTATVTALGECRCERIDGRAFLDAVNSRPVSASLIEAAQGRLSVTYPSQQFEPLLAQ
jgi:MFS family permease